jgi:hypothetical protein
MSKHTTPSSPEQIRISQDVANIKRLKAWRKKHSLGDRADIIYPQDMIYPVYDDADICDFKTEVVKPCDFCGVLPGHIHKDWCYDSSFEHIEIDDMFWGFVISISTLIISAIFVAAAYFIITI